MTEHEKDDPNADTGAYVLNALTEKERIEFEARMSESEATRNEVIELSDAAVLLGLAVEPVQPSAELKANIMAKLASTPQLPREAPAVPVSPQRVEPMGSERVDLGERVERAETSPTQNRVEPVERVELVETSPAQSPAATARARWFTRPTGILMAAAAAVALFVGGNFVGWNIAHNDFAVTQATALAELHAADDVQTVTAAVAGGGSAELIWSLEQRRSAIVIDELPALPENKVYQLWYIDEGGATPAGTFEAASQGKTLRVLDGTMSSGDTIGVTVEPDGGSEQPTTDPVVAITSA